MNKIKLRFLQLTTDLFADPRIRKLKSPGNGYVMLVIYLRLLTLALENNGYIIFDSHFSSLTEQLSFAINDEQEADVEATIAYCVALGLIQVIGLQQQLFFTDFAAMTSKYKQLTFVNKSNQQKKYLVIHLVRYAKDVIELIKRENWRKENFLRFHSSLNILAMELLAEAQSI